MKDVRTRLVKGIEQKVWLQARVKALRDGWRMGDLISELLRLWVRNKVKLPKKERG